jgi:hypothetical protein
MFQIQPAMFSALGRLLQDPFQERLEFDDEICLTNKTTTFINNTTYQIVTRELGVPLNLWNRKVQYLVRLSFLAPPGPVTSDHPFACQVCSCMYDAGTRSKVLTRCCGNESASSLISISASQCHLHPASAPDGPSAKLQKY